RELRLERGNVTVEEPRAFRETDAGNLEQQVLAQHRHTGERAGGTSSGGRYRALVRGGDHGVETGIQRLDSLDRRLHELSRADIARGDERSLRSGVELA